MAGSLQTGDRRVRPRLGSRHGTPLASRGVPGERGHLSSCIWNLGLFPDDARASHCPFVLTSFTGWSSERCPGIGFFSRGDREIGVKQRTPLCSRVATGISWSSLGGLKGVKPPEAFGERSRGWPLGHAGDEGPHLRDDGGGTGWFSSGGPRVRFLTRYDGEVSEPLVGRHGSRVSMRVARGSASLLSRHGKGIWPRDMLKKVSRGLSRVEAGNPGFPRLVQVTSGGFSWWL